MATRRTEDDRRAFPQDSIKKRNNLPKLFYTTINIIITYCLTIFWKSLYFDFLKTVSRLG